MRLILLLMTGVLPVLSISQTKERIAFNDAQTLSAIYQPEGKAAKAIPLNSDSIQDMLHYYCGQNANLYKLIPANTFLAPYFSVVVDTSKVSNPSKNAVSFMDNTVLSGNFPHDAPNFDVLTNAQQTAYGGGSKGAPGSPLSLDVTNIANGMAQFMITRAKEELTITFFQKFQQFSDKYPEFRMLFPKTSDNLKNLLSFSYPDMLPALRTGFFDDLQNLPSDLGGLLSLPKYQRLLQKYPEIPVTIRMLGLIQNIKSAKTSPAVILDQLADFKEWKSPNGSASFRNMGSMVRLARIFSQSLRVEGNNARAWIDLSDFNQIVPTNDPVAFNIYLGLIKEKSRSDSIIFTINNGPIFFSEIMDKQANLLFLLETKLNSFLNLANQVDNLVNTINKKIAATKAVSNDDYYQYINTAIDVIAEAIDLVKNTSEDLGANDFAKITKQANDVFRDIYRQQYTQAITDGINILTEIVKPIAENALNDTLLKSINDSLKMSYSKNLPQKILGIRASTKRLTDKEFSDMKSKLAALKVQPASIGDDINQLESIHPLQQFEPVIEQLSKYGLLIANLATAKSPDEFASIMENAVLPVGSASIKKNSIFNVAIQSYLGANFVLHAPPSNFPNVWSDKVGVTAPIGIAFSWGLKKAGSVSAFVNLLDIGAIVDYQLNYDSNVNSTGTDTSAIQKNYKVSIGQIFSPGFFLVYGLPWNLPLAVGIGTQYGPGLGKINATGKELLNSPGWRTNVFLTVDIPLFNIYNKERNKQ